MHLAAFSCICIVVAFASIPTEGKDLLQELGDGRDELRQIDGLIGYIKAHSRRRRSSESSGSDSSKSSGSDSSDSSSSGSDSDENTNTPKVCSEATGLFCLDSATVCLQMSGTVTGRLNCQTGSVCCQL